MRADSVSQDRLDDVAVGDQCPQRTLSLFGSDPGIDVTDGLQTARLHLGNGLPREKLAVGEPRGTRLVLHDAPQRLFGKLLERAARPCPVAAFTDPLVGLHRDVDQGIHHDLRGLDTALQGAGDHGADRHTAQAFSQIGSLTAADVVEADTRRPPGQRPVGVGAGASVADQQACRHERHCTAVGCTRPETVMT